MLDFYKLEHNGKTEASVAAGSTPDENRDAQLGKPVKHIAASMSTKCLSPIQQSLSARTRTLSFAQASGKVAKPDPTPLDG
jgi:hypothetical protein